MGIPLNRSLPPTTEEGIRVSAREVTVAGLSDEDRDRLVAMAEGYESLVRSDSRYGNDYRKNADLLRSLAEAEPASALNKGEGEATGAETPTRGLTEPCAVGHHGECEGNVLCTCQCHKGEGEQVGEADLNQLERWMVDYEGEEGGPVETTLSWISGPDGDPTTQRPDAGDYLVRLRDAQALLAARPTWDQVRQVLGSEEAKKAVAAAIRRVGQPYTPKSIAAAALGALTQHVGDAAGEEVADVIAEVGEALEADGPPVLDRVWLIQVANLIEPKALLCFDAEQARGWEETGATVRAYVPERFGEGAGENGLDLCEIERTIWREYIATALEHLTQPHHDQHQEEGER